MDKETILNTGFTGAMWEKYHKMGPDGDDVISKDAYVALMNDVLEHASKKMIEVLVMIADGNVEIQKFTITQN